MRALAILLIFLAQCSPVPLHAIELVNGKPVLSAEELAGMVRCAEQGGCEIWTRAAVEVHDSTMRSFYGLITKVMINKAIEDTKAQGCRKEPSI